MKKRQLFCKKRGFGKKAISTLIASIILICLGIVIAILIFYSSVSVLQKSYAKEASHISVAGVDMPSRQACQEVNFKGDLILDGSQGTLDVINSGDVPIYGFKITKIKIGATEVNKSKGLNIEPGAGGSVNLGNLSGYTRLLATPIILSVAQNSNSTIEYTCDEQFGKTFALPGTGGEQGTGGGQQINLTITILSPLESYPAGTTYVDFNISLNKEASWCAYSIDGFENITMALNASKTGAASINSPAPWGEHTIYYYCNDTNDNIATNSTTFNIILPAGKQIDSCRELNEPNTIYLLNKSITPQISTCFKITANNVTLDCGLNRIINPSIAGSSATGISILGVKNTTIRNCIISIQKNPIEGFYDTYGILLGGINNFNNLIDNNILTNNKYGIYLAGTTYSGNNTISNNIISNNNGSWNYDDHGIGIYLLTGRNNTIINNTIDNNDDTGILLTAYSKNNNITSNIMNYNGGGVGLECSSNNTVANNLITNGISGNNKNGYGISITDCDNGAGISLNNNIINNILNYNSQGIDIYNSSNNNLINNTANNNYQSWGIALYFSTNNTLINNTANNNSAGGGILLSQFSDNNTLINNIANYNNEVGIYMLASSNNTLMNNNASNNVLSGIEFWGLCSRNTLINNIINNNPNCGLYLYSDSNSNNITNNNITNNGYGIYIENSENNDISSSIICDNSNQDLFCTPEYKVNKFSGDSCKNILGCGSVLCNQCA
jgi:parallel beta-helix repeat protein